MSKCILFQGDSITDVNRMADGGDGLGQGYVKLISDYFREKNQDVCVLNRGISGNRTGDLVKRWECDCIAYNPDVLTILIGITAGESMTVMRKLPLKNSKRIMTRF